MKKSVILIIGLLICFSLPLLAMGRNEEMTKGNNIYKQGEFNQALEQYDAALVSSPELPEAYFNKGNSHFRLGEFEEARKAYDNAINQTKNLALEGKSRFNIGNSFFMEAQAKAQGQKLKDAIESFRQSIVNYEEAMKLFPKLSDDASKNIELARLIMKDLIDQMKNQAEQDKEFQEKVKKIIEKLQKLIGEEEREVKANGQLQAHLKNNQKDNSWLRALSKLERDQRNNQLGTQDLSREMDQLVKEQQQKGGMAAQLAGGVAQAKGLVDQSVAPQGMAADELKKQTLEPAQQNQIKARDLLMKALELLTQNNDQNQNQQNQQNQDSQDQESEDEKDEQDKEQEQQNQQDQQEQDENKEEEQAAVMEKPEDILEEEREQQEKREAQVRSYADVKKDW